MKRATLNIDLIAYVGQNPANSLVKPLNAYTHPILNIFLMNNRNEARHRTGGTAKMKYYGRK